MTQPQRAWSSLHQGSRLPGTVASAAVVLTGGSARQTWCCVLAEGHAGPDLLPASPGACNPEAWSRTLAGRAVSRQLSACSGFLWVEGWLLGGSRFWGSWRASSPLPDCCCPLSLFSRVSQSWSWLWCSWNTGPHIQGRCSATKLPPALLAHFLMDLSLSCVSSKYLFLSSKIWSASRICVSSLHKSYADLYQFIFSLCAAKASTDIYNFNTISTLKLEEVKQSVKD